MTIPSAVGVLPIPPPRLPEDARAKMALVLRVGLGIALTILFVSLALYLVEHPAATSGSAVGSNPIVPFLTGTGFVNGLASGNPAAYLTLGVFALIATPVARVLTGVYYFRLDGERTMMWITTAVLVLLLVGLFVLGPWIR